MKLFPRLLRWCAQSLLALVLVFALLEAAVRVAGLGIAPRGPDTSVPLLVEVPEWVRLGQKLAPGGSTSVLYPGAGRNPDRVVSYAISSQSLRDREFSLEKPSGALRVCCLGDSVVYGTGVDLADSLPKQLERRLAALFPERTIEVLNAGIFATNTSQQVAWYRHGLEDFGPDLLLLVSTLPDASGRNIPGRPPAQESPGARWCRRLGLTSGLWSQDDVPKMTPAQRRCQWIRRHSKLADLVAHRLYKRLMAGVQRRSYHLDWAADSPGRRSVEESLGLLRQVTLASGTELLVCMYPTLDTLTETGYPYLGEIETLRGICAGLGIDFIDLLPALLGQDARALQVHAHDRHPNGRAHALVAEFLVEPISERLRAIGSGR
jgi:lysophospholipase L1-like esterase